MESIECEFCNNKFKNVSILKEHKKRAKYCIAIQNKINNKKENNLKKCSFCSKFFVSNFINKHLETCKLLKNNIIENFKEEIKVLKIELENKSKLEKILIIDLENKMENEKELKNKDNLIKLLQEKIQNEIQEKRKLREEILELKIELKTKDEVYKKDHSCLIDIAKQPKHISNNNKIVNIQTPFDFNNIELAKQIIEEKYNMNYILEGQKGMADFTVENMLKDENGNFKYICTDPSRNIFKFKDPSGEIIKDVDAKKLTNFLIDGGIKTKACNMAIQWWTNEKGEIDGAKCDYLLDKAESIKSLKEDNTIFKRELISNISV